jgi:CTP:molybdopterin cytidylyltransferase MocA
MAAIDAIVTAGGIPQPGEPLYPLTQGKSKALLPIGGVPMVQWVLDALCGAQMVRSVVVVGLTEQDARLECARPLGMIPNQGGMIANIEAGTRWVLEREPQARYVLLASADVPAITPAVVDWIVTTSLATDHEAYYSVIPAEAMERRFPGSRRSFYQLKDGRFTGSDINIIQTALVGHYHPAWRAIVDARKNLFKQASLIGLDTLLLLVMRQLTVDSAVQRASRRLKVKGRAIICPHAEAGMDVDKPVQYEMVRRDLEARGRAASRSPAPAAGEAGA